MEHNFLLFLFLPWKWQCMKTFTPRQKKGRKEKKSKEKQGRVIFLPIAAVEYGSKQGYCDTE